MDGPTDAELDAIARKVREHRYKERLATGIAVIGGITCAGILVALLRPFIGWLIPACLGFACGGFFYRIFAPGPAPDES